MSSILKEVREKRDESLSSEDKLFAQFMDIFHDRISIAPEKYYVECSETDRLRIIWVSLQLWTYNPADNELLFIYHFGKLDKDTQKMVWPTFAETKDSIMKSSMTDVQKTHKVGLLRMFGLVI